MPTTYYDININISDGSMTASYTNEFKATRNLKDALTYILTNNKDSILNTFPTNQWIYQWIISSNEPSFESFFTAFGVTGNENLMNALRNDSILSDLRPGEYVLSFEGY